MPNIFAYIVLFAWPMVVLILFRRLPLPAALVWSVLGGYLVLPPQTGVDLPVLPPLDKTTVPSFTAAIMCILHKSPTRAKVVKSERFTPGLQKTIFAILSLLFGGLVLTGVTNSEALFEGRFLPGLTAYDIGSMTLDTFIVFLPFILARRHLATREAHLTILRALVLAGVAYSLLILIEVRLSPQLNRWLYGFHAHSFAQQIRFGGFRPTVFIEHGLRVALFITMSLLAGAALWRLKKSPRVDVPTSARKRGVDTTSAIWGIMSLWLFIILILCKSVGAILIAVPLLTMLLYLSPRSQIVIIAAFAGAVLLFPMLRGADLVPTETLVNWTKTISAERAQSLQFRFNNEDLLLNRAKEKPIAGWGTFGRNRVFESDTGRDLSVTDGTWVIFMGSYGWLGYLTRFGLLTLPIFLLAWRCPRPDPETVSLSMVLVANLIDLIPNSGLTPVTWMVAGALSSKVGHDISLIKSRTRRQ